jgi:hypothetical protein
MKKNAINKTPKFRKKKMILTGLAVSAAGILGYFGWQYYKKKKDVKRGDLDTELKKVQPVKRTEPVVSYEPVYTPKPKKKTVSTSFPKVDIPLQTEPVKKTDFPLTKGSKGDKVRQLQLALISKYGKAILPRFGADGDFGGETVAALRKLNLPASISQSTFNVLVQNTTADKTNLPKQLHEAATKKDLSKVLTLLHSLHSKDEYSAVSEKFKSYRINGVRQTLVNGLLNSFPDETQKQKIRLEFLRMGLQYDGNKWSLSGFDGLPIITTQPTTVWINATQGVDVPARMVLGSEVSKRQQYTLFENDGKYFLVNTKSVTYL